MCWQQGLPCARCLKLADMDLIPDDYRKYHRVRHLLRRFVALAVLILMLVGLARGGIAILAERDREAIALLEQSEKTARQYQATLLGLQQRHRVLEARLADSSGGGSGSVRIVLRALDEARTSAIWFERFRFEHGAPSSAHIDGVALDHAGLAAFMRSLAAQPGIAQVQLLDSKTQPSGDIPAVSFNLMLKLTSEAGT